MCPRPLNLFTTERSLANHPGNRRSNRIKKLSEPSQGTVDLLLDFFREQSVFMQKFFSEQKTSHSAVLIFDFIHEHPGTTLSEISRATHFAKSRVKAVIDDFDAKGFITKKSDPQDQRVLRLYLTKAARIRSDEVCQAMRLHTYKLLSAVKPQAVVALHEGLTALSVVLDNFQDDPADQ